MIAMEKGNIYKESLSQDDFHRLSALIQTRCGIKMPQTKKIMLEARLRKRLRALGMDTFHDYCDYVFSEDGMEKELDSMIDVVTTNKTDFFREPGHFDYLFDSVLPNLAALRKPDEAKNIVLWCAGCSTGEEPYTLTMVLNEFAEKFPENRWNYEILATDISYEVLEKARIAIYRYDRIEPVPGELRKKYLLKSKDPEKRLVRIIPELRNMVKFRQLNLMDEEYGIDETVDIIFCRNVIIYFNRQTQEKLLNKLCRYLRLGGYLFMGHAETLSCLTLPLAQVAPAVYQKV